MNTRSSQQCLVQVFIPTYNRAAKLERAVLSVLAQTVRSLEVVVLDNHSEDDTPAVIEKLCRSDPRITYIRRDSNIGMLANFNSIRGLVHGSHFCVLPDDDDYAPRFLEFALAPFEAHSSIRLVACNAMTMQGERIVKSQLDTWGGGLYPAGAAVRRCLMGHYPLVTNCLFSALVREDFYFPPELDNTSDGFLLTCMFAKYDAYVIHEVTGYWRNDGQNASSRIGFQPQRMIDMAADEYRLYGEFARRNRMPAGSLTLLWCKKFFTILACTDSAGFEIAKSSPALRRESALFFATLHLAHTLRLVKAVNWCLRTGRELSKLLAFRRRAAARKTTIEPGNRK